MTGSDERHVEADRRVALAALMRQLNSSLVDAELDAEAIDALSDTLRSSLALVEEFPTSRWWERQPRRSGFAENSPFRGSEHPFAPQLTIHHIQDGPQVRVAATCRLGSEYEGPPGVVHGGMIAALFDEVFALTQVASGADRGARTARLTVRYRQPTPVETDLTFEAGLVKKQGRRSSLEATLSARGLVTATAEALFVGANSIQT